MYNKHIVGIHRISIHYNGITNLAGADDATSIDAADAACICLKQIKNLWGRKGDVRAFIHWENKNKRKDDKNIPCKYI